MILAIDPGRDKCGVALYDSTTQSVLYHAIIATKAIDGALKALHQEYPFKKLVIGDGTSSKEFCQRFSEDFPGCGIEVVDEAYSTLEARGLYFQLHPPKGLKRLLPLSLLSPEGPVDDLVAVVLLQRYLGDMPKIGI